MDEVEQTEENETVTGNADEVIASLGGDFSAFGIESDTSEDDQEDDQESSETLELDEDENPEEDQDDDADKDDKSEEDQDDNIENDQTFAIEGEDGDVTEYKLSELIETHQKYDEMAGEHKKFTQERDQMPPQIEDLALQMQSQLEKNMGFAQIASEFFSGGNGLPELDADLTNPESDKYDPEKYHKQLQAQSQQKSYAGDMDKMFAQFEQEHQQITQQIQEDFQLKQANVRAECVTKTAEFWPEVVNDKDTQDGVVKFLADQYQYSEQEALSVIDPRQFKMIKDLMEYKKAHTKREKASKNSYKILKSVPPKSVRKSARAGQTDNSMAQLRKTGSKADAAAALSNMKF